MYCQGERSVGGGTAAYCQGGCGPQVRRAPLAGASGSPRRAATPTRPLTRPCPPACPARLQVNREKHELRGQLLALQGAAGQAAAPSGQGKKES